MTPDRNLILAGLPPGEVAFLNDAGTKVGMATGAILYEAGSLVSHVFFPHGGLINFLLMSDNGSTIETGFVGPEGAAGLAFDPIRRTHFTTAKVIVANKALRIPVEKFERLLATSEIFRSRVAQNNNRISERGQLLSACNLMHRLEQRLGRWLLQAVNAGPTSTIELTQDSLSQMLGVTRARLNEALKSMEQHGILARPARGFIHIVDLNKLTQMSCACFGHLRFVPV